MTKINLDYDLVNDTPANAVPPEANFNKIEQHINQELIERDGTVAMRAQLRLVNSTPVNPLDAASKGYVDTWLPQSATVAAPESTSSAVATDLTTIGPVVTMVTGTLVRVTLLFNVPASTGFAFMRMAVSGATTILPNVPLAQATNSGDWGTGTALVAVTAGSNTFTAKYFVTSGSATFQNRWIVVERIN